MIWSAEDVIAELKRRAGVGLNEVGGCYQHLLKELVGNPGPYVVTISKSGKPRYRRLVPATKGAPLEMMTTYFHHSVAVDFNSVANVVRVGTDAKYVLGHERKDHPSFMPALTNNLPALGAAFMTGFQKG